MSAEQDKKSKAHGQVVSNEEVLEKLGHPSEWWPRSKKIEFQKHLSNGETELGISGLRGYGRIPGYLDFLEKTVMKPIGVGTGLVSDDTDALIRAFVTDEAYEELRRGRARLVQLEKSPEAVRRYIQKMKSWLEWSEKTLDWTDPENECIEELREMMVTDHGLHLQEIETLKRDIATYEQLLERLRQGSS